ncbi:MAG: NnrU family protein [Pseudorhodobacter sp.]|nr:NnrU family protein [Pseudorhodobacter sp.]
MLMLSLGVVLWVGAHLFKRLAPMRRATMGEKAKGPIALVLLAALVLMIWGYRIAEVEPVYMVLPGMGHVNNALMLVAVFLFGVSGTKGVLYTRMRHPMLWGTVIWAVAHLLVNGDLASILLFGGIGLWALVEMGLINLGTVWTAPTAGRGLKGDAMNLAGALVLYGIIAYVHLWLGHSPFLGTY